ncbi:MAG: HAD family hydrolase [Anaerolineales bacterium]|nr:HAD family hydrolase [Anaerolineales bacterium]
MNASPLRHILFDLGGTLMHSRGDWMPVFKRADQALANKLRDHHITLDTKIFRGRLHEYYTQRDRDCHETTYHFVLRELLKELGYAKVAESVLRSALDALFSVTQSNWVLEDDALGILQKLKSSGYHLGIFSNAGDDQDVRNLVKKFGIHSHFDFVLTSAACYYRKPHARAFEIALAQWSIPPEDAVMIGDSLEADIFGAKNLGMQTIWITRRAQFNEDERAAQRIQPDFSLSDLNWLLPTLEQINLTRR